MPETNPSRPPPNLWKFIRLDEFARPVEPPSEAFRLNLRTIWHRLRTRKPETEIAGIKVPEIRTAPPSLLDWLVPVPDWNEAAARALDDVLPAHGRASHENGLCTVLVGPPHSGIQSIVRDWAHHNEVRLMGPPTAEQILGDASGWLQAWPDDPAELVVLPNLECCFLRHHRGLNIVRWIADRLWTHNQRAIIACDSWAWAYLVQTTQFDIVQPNPLTLAPLRAEDLERWFRETIYTHEGRDITFRRADSGRKVIHRPGEPDDPEYSREYLVHLAVYSRGNPGVAWAIWRDSLAIAIDHEVKPEAQAEASADIGHTIWVRPWDRLTLPALPRSTQDVTLFVLHTLLIHHSLPAPVLDRLLEITRTEVGNHLQLLRLAGILEERDGQWQTDAAAYPAVRSLLQQEGFLVDRF